MKHEAIKSYLTGRSEIVKITGWLTSFFYDPHAADLHNHSYYYESISKISIYFKRI